MKRRVAILGASSHIAAGLISHFLSASGCDLVLFTRSPDKVADLIDRLGGGGHAGRCLLQTDHDRFMACDADVVINCVGVGTCKKLQGAYTNWFTVTERFDNLVIDYLRTVRQDALYISLSSGAVYGGGHTQPVGMDSCHSVAVNALKPESYYGIVRLNAETKHRAFDWLNVVDLRIFAYFSRHMDLTENYFIAEVVDCVLHHKILATDTRDFVRDYVHPDDLFSLVMQCMAVGKINCALDVYSAQPVEKSKILDYFITRHGLRCDFGGGESFISATGGKSVYCSAYQKAREIGYLPKFTSMDTIMLEFMSMREAFQPVMP